MNQRDLFEDRLHTALVFIRCRPELFRKDFSEWIAKNIHVWEVFESQANVVWARGRTHYSARTIGEYLRHETLIAERSVGVPAFKVNDHFWPDLARLYGCFYPERAGMFERRPGQSAVRAA